MHDARAFFLPLVVEINDDGYLVRCPGIQGAFAEGDTIEEALSNCVDVIKMIREYQAERGQSLGFAAFNLPPETSLAVSIPVGVAA